MVARAFKQNKQQNLKSFLGDFFSHKPESLKVASSSFWIITSTHLNFFPCPLLNSYLSITYIRINSSYLPFPLELFLESCSTSDQRRKNKNSIMDEESRGHDQEQRPLLGDPRVRTNQTNFIQNAISQTFRSTAHLANLLPTGTVLGFQLLSPIFSNQGQCDDVSKYMTTGLVIFCGLSCFISSFTDSFRDDKGAVHYGIATLKGLWVVDGSATIPPEDAKQFRLKFIDILHAFMSVLVFAAVTLFDPNVVNCFYPAPSQKTMELLTALPVGIGVFGSALFITFPTTRHGVGFPLSPR